MESDNLLKPAEAASRLKTTVRTLSRWADRGLIEAVTLPTGHRRYPRAAVDEIASSGERAASQTEAIAS